MAHVQFTEKAADQAQGWAAWLAKYVSLFLHCIAAYAAAVAQHASAAAEGPAFEAQSLPCVRLFADNYFMQKLQQVQANFVALAV